MTIQPLCPDILPTEIEFLKTAKSQNKKIQDLIAAKSLSEINLDDFDKAFLRTHLQSAKRQEAIKSKPLNKNKFLIWSKKWNCYFVDVDKVADYLIDMLDCKTIFNKNSEVVYTFDNRIWKANGKELIKTTAEKLLGTYAKTKIINEILEKVKRKTNISRDEFEKTDLNLIPLLNGVWNVKEKKLEPHNSKNNFRFIIEISKNDTAKCLNFKKFLDETCYPEDIPIIQEWFGFCLYRRYFIKRVIILLGEKNTGKSVLLNVLTAFVGELNKTGISLQKLSSGSDFTKLSLKDKLANIFDDLPATDLNNAGNFKMAVGDGYISGEEKFGDYTQFRNYAKHTFAANKIPPIKDNDDLAYFERCMPIKLDNLPEKIDMFLIDKLTTLEELSGILNWSLDGLYRLLEKGKFSYDKTAEQIKVIMETSGNPLLQFSKDVLEENKDGRVTKEEMFEVYSIWANEKDKQKLAKNQLSIQLQKSIKYLIDKRDKLRFWANVSLKPEWAVKLKLEIINTSQKELFKKESNASNNYKEIDDLDTFSKFKGKIGSITPSMICIDKNASNSSDEQDKQIDELDAPEQPDNTLDFNGLNLDEDSANE